MVTNIFTASLLIAQSSSAKSMSLGIGIVVCLGGLLLMFSHRRTYDEAFEQPLSGQRVNFENRKYRRRMFVAAMITSLGIMIAAIYWVEEPRAFASLILIILGVLTAILGSALIDMYSVGLQALASTDEPDRKKLIEEYLKKRQQANSQNDD